MKDYVNTVLRKDGTVVTITPVDGHFDLAVDDKHLTVGPETAADPLNDPRFDAIVRELKHGVLPPSSRTAATDRRRRTN